MPLFYDPQLHNTGGALASGINEGMNLALTTINARRQQERDARDQTRFEQEKKGWAATNTLSDIALRQARNQEAAQKEIQATMLGFEKSTKDLESRLSGLKPLSQAPPLTADAGGALTAPSPPGSGLAETLNAGGTLVSKGATLSSIASQNAYKEALTNHESAKNTIGEEFLKLRAGRDDAIRDTYMKYGMVDKALDYDKTIAETAAKIAVFSPKAALGYIKSTSIGKGISDKDIKSGKAYTSIALRDGRVYTYNNDTGEGEFRGVTISPKEDHAVTSFESYRKGKLAAGWSEDDIASQWVTNQSARRENERRAGKAEKSEGVESSLKVGDGTAVSRILDQRYLDIVLNDARANGIDTEGIAKISKSNVMNFAGPKQRQSRAWIEIRAENYAKDRKNYTPAQAVDQALKDYQQLSGGGAGAAPAGNSPKDGETATQNGKQYIYKTNGPQGGSWYEARPAAVPNPIRDLTKPPAKATAGAATASQTATARDPQGNLWEVDGAGKPLKMIKKAAQQSAVEAAKGAESDENSERLKAAGRFLTTGVKKGWGLWSDVVSAPTRIAVDYQQKRKAEVEATAESLKKEGKTPLQIHQILKQKYGSY